MILAEEYKGALRFRQYHDTRGLREMLHFDNYDELRENVKRYFTPIFIEMIAALKEGDKNFVKIEVTYIADNLKVKKKTIYNALVLLRRFKLIKNIKGRRGVYLLNPSLVWSGDKEERLRAIEEWLQQDQVNNTVGR